ncbi:MerR family transcriptional regulator [Micromonospora sp. NPDC049662]|uniref:MerR family transcriptional regulator n=1 Tax=Micromonospora sp. NPDC049662 TaxID=3155397 RepID=UPI0034363EB9
MFSLRDFAAFGRVSVHMLRHYDATGLLRPAATDPVSGHRYYHANQLHRLDQIIVLKDLGLPLVQVADILDNRVTVKELRGMLRLRRAQLEQLSANVARLAGLDARLRMIAQEGHINTGDVTLKRIPQARVAELSEVVASYEESDTGLVIGPLYQEIWRRLNQSGATVTGSPIAYYVPEPGTGGDGQEVRVHAAVEVAADTPAGDGTIDILDLPGIESAVTILHRGPMAEAFRSMQVLARWIDDNGYMPVGYAREVCLEFDPGNPANWVHEFQLGVVRP